MLIDQEKTFSKETIYLYSSCAITGAGIIGFSDVVATVAGLLPNARIAVAGELILTQDQQFSELNFVSGSISGDSVSI